MRHRIALVLVALLILFPILAFGIDSLQETICFLVFNIGLLVFLIFMAFLFVCIWFAWHEPKVRDE